MLPHTASATTSGAGFFIRIVRFGMMNENGMPMPATMAKKFPAWIGVNPALW